VVVNGRLLLDGGAPLLPHMHRVGVDAGDIEAVFLTHFHGDHTLGLPPFVLHRVFVDQRPITFVGPAGLEERLEALWEVSWGIDWKPVMRPRFNVTYQEAEPEGVAAGYRYETIKLDHGTSGCNGYRIWVDGRIIAYSGDTEPTSPLDRLVDGADVAIVEATGPGDVFRHMSWEIAAALRKRHPKTRFMFNHLYDGTVEGAVAQPEHEAHGGMRFGEARDLVVDQAGVEPDLDQVSVAKRGPRSLRPDHPDRTVGLDPGLELCEPARSGDVPRAQEHQVAEASRAPLQDITGAPAQELQESGVVQVDDRHLRAGLDPELVQQRPGGHAVLVRSRAQTCSSFVPALRTAPKTITPSSQPA
jgi:phosphoribosyl 1,2-cyclic phosphodiesterase